VKLTLAHPVHAPQKQGSFTIMAVMRMEKALLTNALPALDWLARLAHGNSTRSAGHAAEKARATPTSPRQRAPVSP
jgi:hypothetical protein